MSIAKQRGWTFSGLLTFLIVGGIFVSIGFKLAPAYADYQTLKSIMNDTVADRDLLAKSNYDIQLSVIKKLRVNNTVLPEAFYTIERDKGSVHFNVDYEIRTPIFYNVDAVVSFKERFTGQERE